MNASTGEIVGFSFPAVTMGDGTKRSPSEMREGAVYARGRLDAYEQLLALHLGGVP